MADQALDIRALNDVLAKDGYWPAVKRQMVAALYLRIFDLDQGDYCLTFRLQTVSVKLINSITNLMDWSIYIQILALVPTRILCSSVLTGNGRAVLAR